jgi:hypothetical protein
VVENGDGNRGRDEKESGYNMIEIHGGTARTDDGKPTISKRMMKRKYSGRINIKIEPFAYIYIYILYITIKIAHVD